MCITTLQIAIFLSIPTHRPIIINLVRHHSSTSTIIPRLSQSHRRKSRYLVQPAGATSISHRSRGLYVVGYQQFTSSPTGFIKHHWHWQTQSAIAGNTGKRQAAGTTHPVPRPVASNVNIPGLQIPAAFGVGPVTQSTPTAPPGPVFDHQAGPSLIIDDNETSDGASRNCASSSDVWFFTRGLRQSGPPPPAPANDRMSPERPDPEKFKFLTCRLCSEKFQNWKNQSNQGSSIRKHMRKFHNNLWSEMVVKFRLKNWQTVKCEARHNNLKEREPFSIAGFYERLLRWIAVDDQSVAVVESPELRDLFLFIGMDLKESDIPHRTKVGQLLTKAFQEEYDQICADIRSSPGRVSLTSDVWSRVDLRGCMAITAHFLKKDPTTSKLVLRSELIAFRRLFGSHSGARMGEVFFDVLKEVGCLSKLGTITLDNASNNQTMMAQLEMQFQSHNIPFDRVGNRIRCFPHVVNIAVKTAIKELPKPYPLPLPPNPESSLNTNDFNEKVEAYQALANCRTALQSDLVARVRSFVTFCRASIERRERFDKIIKDGNAQGGFGVPKKPLKAVGLLKDVDTRWSSSYNMIKRFLQQYPACQQFIASECDWDFEHSFSDSDIAALKNIRDFLGIFHSTQELVSAQKTLTLSYVIVVYGKLLDMIKKFAIIRPQLAHVVDIVQDKLLEYLGHARKTKIYTLAMVIHPRLKYSYMEDNWDSGDVDEAKKTIKAVLLEYQQHYRRTATSSEPRRVVVNTQSASHSAQKFTKGMANVVRIERQLSNAAAIVQGLTPQSSLSSVEEEAEQLVEDAANILREDIRAVERAISRWIDEGTLTDDDLGDFDLVEFWRRQPNLTPLLSSCTRCPTRASFAVPCERVFSSSKESDTNRRSGMEDERMEELQILKFRYRNDRLDFTVDPSLAFQELSVIDLSEDQIQQLILAGKLDELETLIEDSQKGWGAELGPFPDAYEDPEDDVSDFV